MRFGIRDTVFLAVTTENPAPDSRVSVRVRTSDGTVVDSTGKSVDRMGGTATGERVGTQTGSRTGTQMGTGARTGTHMGQTGQTGTYTTGAQMGTSG